MEPYLRKRIGRDRLGAARGIDRREHEVGRDARLGVQREQRVAQPGHAQGDVHARIQRDGHGREEDRERRTEQQRWWV